MRFYFVDYENVQANGLRGVKNISPEDRVFLFYTENANKLDFSLYEEFLPIHTQIEPFCVQPGQHSLDFQLSSFLGYQLAENPDTEMVIVSKDNGFNSVVRFWTGKGRQVLRVPALAACLMGNRVEKKPEPQTEEKETIAAEKTEASKETAVNEEAVTETAATPETKPAEEKTAEPAEATEESAAPVLEPVVTDESTEKEPEPTAEPAAAANSEEATAKTEKPQEKRSNRRRKPTPRKTPRESKTTDTTAPNTTEAEQNQAGENAAPTACEPQDGAPNDGVEAEKTSEPSPLAHAAVKQDLLAKLPELTEQDAGTIVNLIGRYKTRLGLNNALQKDFGSDRTGAILKAIRPYIRDKK